MNESKGSRSWQEDFLSPYPASSFVPSSWEEGENPHASADIKEVLEETLDTLAYLDENLLTLEYALGRPENNQELLRLVFGALIRLYGLFWTLGLSREFRMVAQAKALWSYIHHGAMPLDRDHLRLLSTLGHSLEGHLVSFAQQKDVHSVLPNLQPLEMRRRDRDELWSAAVQEQLEHAEQQAIERISLGWEYSEHAIPSPSSERIHDKMPPVSSPAFGTDMSSLYTTLREMGHQLQDLKEQLGTQISSVTKQSLNSIHSLYRYLRKGLRTLYSQSDDKIGIYGLIFSYEKQCVFVPTSQWLEIIPCERVTWTWQDNPSSLLWSGADQPISVHSLSAWPSCLAALPAQEELPKVGPQWLQNTLELEAHPMNQEAEHPFVEPDHGRSASSQLQGFCIVMKGNPTPYALHVDAIVGEMMVALLETTRSSQQGALVRALGLLPDGQPVRILDISRLERLVA